MEINTLQHHGIKGQKWGVRRYQNADGSLTSDGKKRYGSGDGSASKTSEADAQKKERTKKIIAGVAVAATLTAATAVYLKNKDVRLDDDGRFTSVLDTSLNSCLTLEANIDQTGRSFIQDVVMSMLDEGCVAIVPVDTDLDPDNGSFKIETLRTGKVLDWYPKHVKLSVYNDRTGEKENIIVPKSTVAIVENPFYAVMNAPNSTLQRLIRKLNILDAIDEQSGSGKLNLIIQLPYVIKTEARRQQAENRRKDIEEQLAGSKYGVAYTDGTEHVVQLNRPVDNNLMSQIEYLTSMLYSQLGLTQSIMDGSADDKTNSIVKGVTHYANSKLFPRLCEQCYRAGPGEV